MHRSIHNDFKSHTKQAEYKEKWNRDPPLKELKDDFNKVDKILPQRHTRDILWRPQRKVNGHKSEMVVGRWAREIEKGILEELEQSPESKRIKREHKGQYERPAQS